MVSAVRKCLNRREESIIAVFNTFPREQSTRSTIRFSVCSTWIIVVEWLNFVRIGALRTTQVKAWVIFSYNQYKIFDMTNTIERRINLITSSSSSFQRLFYTQSWIVSYLPVQQQCRQLHNISWHAFLQEYIRVDTIRQFSLSSGIRCKDSSGDILIDCMPWMLSPSTLSDFYRYLIRYGTSPYMSNI